MRNMFTNKQIESEFQYHFVCNYTENHSEGHHSMYKDELNTYIDKNFESMPLCEMTKKELRSAQKNNPETIYFWVRK